MGDVASGTGSSVAQTYLKEVLENFFSFSQSVRLAALSVVATILRQGLTHPVQTVPYLIAMQTDCDPASRVKAEAQLQEIENKFPGFTNMRAIEGVCFSYRLQCVLHAVKKATGGDRRESAGEGGHDTSTEVGGNNSTSSSSKQTRRNADNGTTPADVTSEGGLNPFANAIRGAKEVDSDIPNALNSQLYSMLRANITSRRAFLKGMINLFDEMQDISLGRLVYVADNLAFFPYQCQAEPLFVIHHIDLLVSVNGSTRLQAVREAFFPELKELLAAQTALSNSGQSTSVANTWSSPGFAVNDIMHHPDTQSTQQASGIQEALMRLDLEEEKEDVLIGRVTSANAEQLNQIRESIRASRACLLLLNLKQYLKEVYGITDSKIQKFSPSDANKMWDKQLTRKSGVRFTPDLCLRSAIDELENEGNPNSHENAPAMSEEMARDLVQEFFEFRKLILSIDPPDDEGLDGTVTNVDDTAGQANPAEDVPMRLASDRSLVPQSHAPHSSDEEDDSADSDAAGASRLLLAQSAPQKRRGLRNHHTVARGSKAAPPSTSKRKSFSRQPRARSAFILSSESESEVESLSEEEESS
ncbi:unnamed protein product [Hymenolepis diminuta]|nr:unnamed protein product [Hymenolepis diminuta]